MKKAIINPDKHSQLLQKKDSLEEIISQKVEFEQYETHLKAADQDKDLALYYKIRDLVIDLKDIRKRKKMTQKEIAEKMGTKQTAVSRFEYFSSTPTLEFIHNYCCALGVELIIKPLVPCNVEYIERCKSDQIVAEPVKPISH